MSTPITCLHCGGQLGPGDRFCAECGSELLWCASCGEFLLQAEESCPKCGTPGIPRPDSRSIPPFDITEDDSPWTEVVTRLRRATLGEFEIGHELGRGGMAAVFLAHELSLHRDVAIKVMSPGLLMGDGMIERFRREAITIAHLNHPNIVSVYSVRASEGLHFFVMRCIQGRSLEQVLKDAGRLPVPIVRSILQHVGSALAYAHRFKVVHRDIKPANILIDEEANAVVTDFGIAKATEGPSQTHSGFMVGTPAYMSPEQCAGGEVSGASDQYSLGAVAYEMITGTPPFTGSTYSVIQAHVEVEPRPLRDHCEHCPPELEAAVLRMLAKNPEDRWPGMQQALTALGATALAEDDPLRAELSRLAMAGARTTFSSVGTAGRGAGKTSAVLQVTPPGMMRGVTILPPPPGLEVGDSFLLVARVHDGHAARLPSGPVEWSSDAPGVLRVNATKAVATAITPGSAVIRATCDGNEGRLRVSVAPPRADSITVKPLDKQITVGDEIHLEASPRDKRGRVVTRPVTWRSDDDAVATVSLEGILIARSGGTTLVTAELDEARATVTVTILPPRVAAVHISAAPDTIVPGDSFQLIATPLDRWAGALSERTVAWSVSDVNVAIVTASGWVIARNPGLVVLTATCEGVSSSISVNVMDRMAEPLVAVAAPPTSPRTSRPEPWELPPDSRSPEPRRQRSRPGWLVATGGAFLVAGGFWLVGGREPLSQQPAETAVAIRDTTSVEIPAAPASVAVVDSSAPAALVITQRPAVPLEVGSSASLSVEVRGLDGRLLPGTEVTWSSTDSAVVSVDSSTGTVQAVGRGRAQVVAAAGSLSDSAGIVVRTGTTPPPPAVPESLSIATYAPLQVGDTLTLRARLVDGQGRPVRRARVSWSSSDPTVAAVNGTTGRVRAYAPGNTLIIARSGELSDFRSLSVNPADVSSVSIVGAAPLKVGDTLHLTAEPRDRWGRAISGRDAVWSSSSPEVAAVDSASGTVIAAAAGSTEITATVDGKSVSRRLTVLRQPRTSREEPTEEVAAEPAENAATDPAADRQRAIEQMVAGVERCYGALRQKDVAQVEEFYKPESNEDREKLGKLARILRTREWSASVGDRVDGAQRLDESSVAMDFGFRMTWKDAFGGRITSRPVFRAEFTRNADGLQLSSCRIINSPRL